MTALGGTAGAPAMWSPQPQPPQGLSVAEPRAGGQPEQSLQQQWCGRLGEEL